ncbi:DUF423 domain-containing protein [Brevibacillus humidisoli]|uniref:DUF423 domain-containing protein n=1 Tax=Brevibacillus humidisoli TaxID=2895522 RepID=UPI001E3A0BB8|nr:DUF423 domain-containing protein [Brevibacillus humidisoli]UFJ41502.1 DUF423 domain-containing protein [Brevibacillus humidisoli]
MAAAFLVIGSIAALLAVALGAFGAHALKRKLSADMLAIFQTGVQYQMIHAIAILLIGGWWKQFGALALFSYAGWFFLAGILLFSGSLYALSLSGVRKLGAITPLGGLCFLAGWFCLVLAGLSIG